MEKVNYLLRCQPPQLVVNQRLQKSHRIRFDAGSALHRRYRIAYRRNWKNSISQTFQKLCKDLFPVEELIIRIRMKDQHPVCSADRQQTASQHLAVCSAGVQHAVASGDTVVIVERLQDSLCNAGMNAVNL